LDCYTEGKGSRILERLRNLSLHEQGVTSRKTRIFQNGEINQAVIVNTDFEFFIYLATRREIILAFFTKFVFISILGKLIPLKEH
jgi:hypothetical protein